MRYFVGIDLHSDNNYIGVIDKKDSRIFGKKLPNDSPFSWGQACCDIKDIEAV